VTSWVERGERVHLRALSAQDEAEFLRLVRASRRLHRPWAYPPDSPEGFADLLRRQDAPTEAVFLVCRNEDGAIVGMTTLGQIFLGALRSAYLGYFGFAPHQGHGSMTEGVRLTLRYAFRSIRLHRVEANVQPGNERSIALVRRLGFRFEGFSPRYLKIGGRWCDHERYALLAGEFVDVRTGRRNRDPA
jgi:[ribosomal protein S5]-alanine N-acetyltransferase